MTEAREALFECPRCDRPLVEVSNDREAWMQCPGCFYDAGRKIKPPPKEVARVLRRWKVVVAYTVYVEHDEEGDVEQIAIEFLDEEFAHAYTVTVTPMVGEPDDFTFRLEGWARDSQEPEPPEPRKRITGPTW